MSKKKVILLLTVEFIILSFLFYGICCFWLTYQNFLLLSSVKAPVRWALSSIAKDFDANNYTIAKKKLAELQTQWNEFDRRDDADGCGCLGDIMVKFRDIEENATKTKPPAVDEMRNKKDLF